MATMMKKPERGLPDYISETSDRADVRAGSPLPLGTQEKGGGVNFAMFSRDASRVRLELFDHPEDVVPARVIDLDSARNRTGEVWHVWVEGIGPGQLYACRVDGPYEPSEGHRFNFNRLFLDPFATAISRLPPRSPQRSRFQSKAVLSNPEQYQRTSQSSRRRFIKIV
jgi:isoamylase